MKQTQLAECLKTSNMKIVKYQNMIKAVTTRKFIATYNYNRMF